MNFLKSWDSLGLYIGGGLFCFYCKICFFWYLDWLELEFSVEEGLGFSVWVGSGFMCD